MTVRFPLWVAAFGSAILLGACGTNGGGRVGAGGAPTTGRTSSVATGSAATSSATATSAATGGPSGGGSAGDAATGAVGSAAQGSGGYGAGGGSTGGTGGAGGTMSGSDGGPSSCVTFTDDGDTVAGSNCVVQVRISKKTGLADYVFGDTVRVKQASASYRTTTDLHVEDATTHSISIDQLTPLQDGLGAGKRWTVSHAFAAGPTLKQNYYLYDRAPFVLVEEEIESAQPVSSNRMTPFSIGSGSTIDLGGTDSRILLVPFHNDEFTRYDARAIDATGESYEVAALYDNASRAGMVVGSVTHDTWKSAVAYTGTAGKIQTLDAYGGASSAATQDTQPHGSISGTSIRSPRMFVGWFSDWRDGLESFGRTNALLASNGHPWAGGVIFGFNTWSAYECTVTEAIFEKASDFVAKQLVPKNFKGASSTFMNWDACGTPSSSSIAYLKGNGLRGGAYLTPFTSWGDGTDPRILKDARGVPLPKIDNGYPLDPTHPDVKSSVLASIARLKSLGYEYVKLDFMTHAVREGAHYDKTMATGVQAYNYGLNYIAEAVGGTMFIDLSISPLFPGGQYAHARRVSCDAFGGIANSEYLLNNAGYGWWLSGGVYQYNDPDHVVLATSAADGNQLHTVNEARTRVNASAIAGTVFLDSDKLDGDTEAQTRASMLLTNADINAIARRGKAFRPVEGNTGTKATNVFVSSDAGKFYLAVFNFNGGASATVSVNLARAGLDPAATYAARDLWSGMTTTTKATLPVTLDKASSTIYELVAAP